MEIVDNATKTKTVSTFPTYTNIFRAIDLRGYKSGHVNEFLVKLNANTNRFFEA
jgi:hypothetical protein